VLAEAQLVEYFRKVKAPYNLNSITQAEGVRVMQGVGEAAEEVDKILEERSRVEDCLGSIKGVERIYPSEANFLLFRCSDATRIYQKLLSEGIVVRDRSSLAGLEDCIRMTIGTREENTLFLQRLKHCLEGGVT
jgi:histidinol-phosphate aminotransferase